MRGKGLRPHLGHQGLTFEPFRTSTIGALADSSSTKALAVQSWPVAAVAILAPRTTRHQLCAVSFIAERNKVGLIVLMNAPQQIWALVLKQLQVRSDDVVEAAVAIREISWQCAVACAVHNSIVVAIAVAVAQCLQEGTPVGIYGLKMENEHVLNRVWCLAVQKPQCWLVQLANLARKSETVRIQNGEGTRGAGACVHMPCVYACACVPPVERDGC